MAYLIKRNGEVLATLIPFLPDNFWWECHIIKTQNFSTIEESVRVASDTEDMDLFHKIWDEIYEMGVVLVSTDDEELVLNPFIIHFREDETVSMRY